VPLTAAEPLTMGAVPLRAGVVPLDTGAISFSAGIVPVAAGPLALASGDGAGAAAGETAASGEAAGVALGAAGTTWVTGSWPHAAVHGGTTSMAIAQNPANSPLKRFILDRRERQ